ncbi:MAG TPA: DsbA family protein [archaeon]|nr:DsbA family protein [archaeon]
MSKLKEIKTEPKKESGSLLFTAIAAIMILGILAIVYFALFSPAPSLDVSALEKGGHVAGNPDAKISIVEFSDFQCPACGAFFLTEKRILSEFGDKVKFIYRHFPLPQHTYAPKSAEASECASEQGKFWEMHDKLFENQENLALSDLRAYASEIGLESAKFNQCLETGKYAPKVASDLALGNSVGVNATPTIFINGAKQQDTSYEGIKAAIERAS